MCECKFGVYRRPRVKILASVALILNILCLVSSKRYGRPVLHCWSSPLKDITTFREFILSVCLNRG